MEFPQLMPRLEHDANWQRMLAPVAQQVAQNPLGAGRLVVLLPYAQLMGEARAHWRRSFGHLGASPRFESSRNWAANRAAFVPSGLDLAFNTAHDLATAAQLLAQAGLVQRDGRDHAAGGGTGAAGAGLPWALRLLEAAMSLAPVAAAQPEATRVAWAQGLMPALAMGDAALNAESALGQLALTWVGQSRYATDVLFTTPAEGCGMPQALHLFVVRGFAADPLTQALAQRWCGRVTELPLHTEGEPASALGPGRPAAQALRLYPCTDAADEADCAAALVLQWATQHENTGGEDGVRLALVAQDRTLTRRIAAILSAHGVAMFDETGWMLSTTRAAASLMALLRAMAPLATGDEVLQAVKAMPVLAPHVSSELEGAMRKAGAVTWPGFVQSATAGGKGELALQTVQALRANFCAKPKRLDASQWLLRLCQLLADCGFVASMHSDAAFQKVAFALGLTVQNGGELALVRDDFALQLTQSEFCAWVGACLEADTFKPDALGAAKAAAGHPPEVCVLPLPQLLGRHFDAVVLAGCDERNMPPVPPQTGWWTAAQRAALGLPTHEARLAEAQGAWAQLLGQQNVHVLWRAEHDGAALLPSAALQGFLLARAQQGQASVASILSSLVAVDPRGQVQVSMRLGAPPLPVAKGLLKAHLSATAYQDLRTCPYRFYALRCLGLQEAPELDEAASKRDMGIWLHLALRLFHETRPAAGKMWAPGQTSGQASGQASGYAGRDAVQDAAHADLCAHRARQTLGLLDADFLPYALAWPRLRDRYLAWLAEHEAQGHTFQAAEYQPSTERSGMRWVGAIDRIDEAANGGLLVIDYKAQSNKQVQDRLKDPMDDVQLPFYAALLDEHALDNGVAHQLSAGYLSLSDAPKESVHFYPHADLEAAKIALQLAVERDFSAMRDGAPLAALGAGRACQHCKARGLCRTDFRGGLDMGVPGDDAEGGSNDDI